MVVKTLSAADCVVWVWVVRCWSGSIGFLGPRSSKIIIINVSSNRTQCLTSLVSSLRGSGPQNL